MLWPWPALRPSLSPRCVWLSFRCACPWVCSFERLPRHYTHLDMNLTRRSGAIALAITLGVLIVGGLIAFTLPWILLNERRCWLSMLGIVLACLLIAGVVLNTIFLVREVRRNERQDSFLNAVTHELKTPIASIRLYL